MFLFDSHFWYYNCTSKKGNFTTFIDAMGSCRTKESKKANSYSFLNQWQILNVCKAEVLEKIHSFNVSERY